MKCILFVDDSDTPATYHYNKWAKDKQLAKDVIVHSHVIQPYNITAGRIIIIVFFDEKIHPDW